MFGSISVRAGASAPIRTHTNWPVPPDDSDGSCPKRRFDFDWRSSRGVAVVESALILLVFFTLILGVMEIGRFLSVQLTLTDAAREGARMAVTPVAGTSTLPSDGEIQGYVQGFLDSNGLSSATVTVDRDIISAEGDVFTMVEVTFPYQVLTASLFSDLEVTLAGRSRMRNETSP